MKKILLIAFFAIFTVQFAVAQTPAEKEAAVYMNMENKRTGFTLTEEQKKEVTALYAATFSKEYESADAKKVATREANSKVMNIFTPEQKQARQEYFRKLNEARAKAAGQ